MSAVCQSACSSWATVADVCAPCNTYDYDQALLEDMLAVATDILFERSGKRWPGTCSDTVRPIRQCPSPGLCRCGHVDEIKLGVSLLLQITEVKVDGLVLDPSLYRIDNFRTLVRLPNPDGSNPGWPRCQRMDLPSTEDRTFEVSLVYGSDPPPAGRIAASRLACELAQGCSSDDAECALPRSVTQRVRQGVSETVMPLGLVLAELPGRIGIWEVDLFLDTYNPDKLRQRARVISPDIGPSVRRAGT